MNYGAATRLSVNQVLLLAEQFFGPDGLGLEVKERRPDGLAFSGPQGVATVRAQAEAGSTEVFLTTEGLDFQVRQFMVEIFEETLHGESVRRNGTEL